MNFGKVRNLKFEKEAKVMTRDWPFDEGEVCYHNEPMNRVWVFWHTGMFAGMTLQDDPKDLVLLKE